MLSSFTELNIAPIYTHRNLFAMAENYCQRALSHARLYEGEEKWKTDLLCKALKVCSSNQVSQGNYADAVAFAEEAYDCVAIVYNPVHLEVQEAAGELIECLSLKGDMYNAERFAQATLDSLKDPANKVDQESEVVARGYYNLANVIFKQNGDLTKAEMLARESIRIGTVTFHNGHLHVGAGKGLLAGILMAQGKLDNETKELLEHSLAINIINNGKNGSDTAASNSNLGKFYRLLAEIQQTSETRREQLHLSQSKYKEALRIFTEIFGCDNPKTVQVSSALSRVSSMLSEI